MFDEGKILPGGIDDQLERFDHGAYLYNIIKKNGEVFSDLKGLTMFLLQGISVIIPPYGTVNPLV